MPSACFDAIRNVSTPGKHAEGMSLRYGAVIFGDLTHPQIPIRRWRTKKASLHHGGVGWLDYLEIIVISVRGQLLCLGV